MSKQDWPGKERLGSPRYPFAVRVEFAGGEGKFFHTRDVSSTGLFLICDDPPEVGSSLKINIALPDVRQVLPVEAKVVRCVNEGDNKGVGIQFENVPWEFTALINEALEKLEKSA